jgi:hypothetical protein
MVAIVAAPAGSASSGWWRAPTCALLDEGVLEHAAADRVVVTRNVADFAPPDRR